MSDAATSVPPSTFRKPTINPAIPIDQQYRICTKPPSSLDPSETPVDSTDVNRLACTLRFGNAENERNNWLKNLHRTDMPFHQQERFRKCGTCPIVLYDPETDAVRLATETCKSRFCPACRKHRQHRWIRTITAALDHLPTSPWKLITLTQKHDDTPLKQQNDRLRKSFRRLRQTGLWKSHIDWGIAVLEVSYNGETHQWHPHLHILAPCRWIDYTELRKAWIKATRGSHIIDVKQVATPTHAVRYLAKYLGKPPSAAIFTEPDRLNEYYLALAHAKMLLPFGQYPEDAKAVPPEKSATNWVMIDRLSIVLALARNNFEPAQTILDRLRRRASATKKRERTLFDDSDTEQLPIWDDHPPDP